MTTNLESKTLKSCGAVIDSTNFINQLKKSYQTDQQLKYLKLQAEIDLLLHQVQTNKINQK